MFMQIGIGLTIIDLSQYPHMRSKNKTTSHFSMFGHFLIIYKLHGSWVYV